jgi:hypothetical protein
VSLITKPRIVTVAVALAAAVGAAPTLAEAQRRRPARGPVVRSYVYVGPYAYPRFYSGWWYQWGYPYPPYGYRYGLNDFTASLRLQVTPRDAEVFVDGYRAGVVDDFDGVFQRLRLRPGGHEITIFLEGYETARQAIYLEIGGDRKLEFSLNRLAAGERSEPPPPPSPSAYDEEDDGRRSAPPARRSQPSGDDRDVVVERAESNARFGTLSLRVQPGDAEILIDGERWSAPANQDRVSIQLTEGRHRVEVRRQGMASYAEDVLIRRGATMTLNVSLK